GDVSPTWVIATDIVKKVRPVPWAFWVLIRSVWGEKNPDKISIDSSRSTGVESLILKAVEDKELLIAPLVKTTQYAECFRALGPQTIASLCFIHAVCKRVSLGLQERVFKAIIEDALLRARLGVVLSQFSPKLSIG